MDECTDYVKIELKKLCYHGHDAHDVPLEPTHAQVLEAEQKVAKLPEELKKLLPPIGLYLIYSTS